MYQSIAGQSTAYQHIPFADRNAFLPTRMPTIRQGRVEDAVILNAIWMAARESIPLKIRDDQFDEYVTVWQGWCRAQEVWVIEADDQIAALMRISGPEIMYLVTAADHANNGYARRLVEYAKDLAAKKSLDHLMAKVKHYNSKIINLLESCGFIYDSDRTLQDRYGWDCYICR